MIMPCSRAEADPVAGGYVCHGGPWRIRSAGCRRSYVGAFAYAGMRMRIWDTEVVQNSRIGMYKAIADGKY